MSILLHKHGQNCLEFCRWAAIIAPLQQ